MNNASKRGAAGAAENESAALLGWAGLGKGVRLGMCTSALPGAVHLSQAKCSQLTLPQNWRPRPGSLPCRAQT
eukprot:gene13049-biopygen18538